MKVQFPVQISSPRSASVRGENMSAAASPKALIPMICNKPAFAHLILWVTREQSARE